MAESRKFPDLLFKPVDSLPADLFRMFFGITMILQFASLMKFNFLDIGILAPHFHFTYDFFDFVKPGSPALMKFIMLMMLVSAVLITVNKFYKAGIIIFLLTFTYLFLLEKSYYNNHFYFIILLSIILLFYKHLPSVKQGIKVIPQWFIWLLQFQVIVVYFYGGLAKLNHDWLVNSEPVKAILEINAKNSAFSPLLKIT